MTSSLENVMFSTLDGKELFSINTIDEIELTADSENEDDTRTRYFDSKEMTLSIDIEKESVDKILKHIVYGGDRGRYNGYVLKRDGYLSQKNAWLGKKHE